MRIRLYNVIEQVQQGINMKKLITPSGFEILVDEEIYVWAKNMSWNISPRGYARTWIRKDKEKRKYVTLHRLIMNAKKGELVDHINRNKLDNRKENLRFASFKLNSLNRIGKGESKYKGVCKHKSGWQVYVGGKYIGLFKDEIIAAKVYDFQATKIYGNDAVTNEKLGIV